MACSGWVISYLVSTAVVYKNIDIAFPSVKSCVNIWDNHCYQLHYSRCTHSHFIGMHNSSYCRVSGIPVMPLFHYFTVFYVRNKYALIQRGDQSTKKGLMNLHAHLFYRYLHAWSKKLPSGKKLILVCFYLYIFHWILDISIIYSEISASKYHVIHVDHIDKLQHTYV